MNELIPKMLEAGKKEALKSPEAFKAAAKELGYTDAQIEGALGKSEGFPLYKEVLDEIAGGLAHIRGCI